MQLRVHHLWYLATCVALGQPQDREFVSAACHLSFRHPATWTVRPDSLGENACAFRLRPTDWPARLLRSDSVDTYSMTLEVYSSGVWDVVPEHGFERRSSGWFVLGRQGIAGPADSVSGSGWTGLRGTRTVGCFREGDRDTYAGLCEGPAAIVGTPTWAVAVEGGPESEDVVEQLLLTLRILP